MGVPMHQVLFIDDSATNIEGARAAGLPSELVCNEDEIVALLERLL